jgi:hypothetical protein
MIDGSLSAFLQGNVGIHLATRNAGFEPNGGRALAATVDAEGVHLTVYVATVVAERLRADLEANGQVAVGFARPTDERACQLKGQLVSLREAAPEERGRIDTQWEAFLQALGAIGIPREPLARWPRWPASAITLKVTAIFEQTPRPGTGEPMR